VNENLFFNNVPESLEENLKAMISWAARRHITIMPGLDMGRRYTVPQVEA
jgi:hypothetical protein